MQPLEAVQNHLPICLTTERAGRKSQERHWGGWWVIVLQQQGEGTGVSHLGSPRVPPPPHLVSEWQFHPPRALLGLEWAALRWKEAGILSHWTC